MQRNNNIQHWQSEQPQTPPSEPNLSELKLKVMLSNLQLLQLTANDDKFYHILHQYNGSGVECIRKGNHEQALVYLEEAEKILQYSASCGKTIDRFLIVVTLQNEAAAYQKLWELEKSADYMEAILYNMNSYLENSLPIEMTHEIRNQSSEPYKSFTTFIAKRMDAVAYNLQYSAVSSQIGKHDTALFSAKKALEVLSVVLTELYSYECFVKNKINKNSQLKLLRDLCRGCKNEKVVPLIKYIQNKFISLKQNGDDQGVSEKFKTFGIGDVMQIQPIDFGSKIESIVAQMDKFSLMKKALFISISYYAISTELRLLSNTESLGDQKALKLQNQKSKIYHLNAIKIVLEFVNCRSEYLEHIMKSFKNNYQIDLQNQEQFSEEDEEDILFSQMGEDSFQKKNSEEKYLRENQLLSENIQEHDPFEQVNHSFDKKRHSLQKGSFIHERSKSKKSKKLKKIQSSTNLKMTEYKFRTLGSRERKKIDGKQKVENSRSRKSFCSIKSRQLKNTICTKKKESANSTEKTKDQTKKADEHKAKIAEEYKTVRVHKIRETEKKKKNKDTSRKKQLKFKSPQIKSHKNLPI